MAYGGNFYAIVDLDDLSLAFERSAKNQLLAAGLSIMDAINAQRPTGAPAAARHRGLSPRLPEGTRFHRTALPSRHGDLPRLVRPIACGTGTSARMAQLHARGELALGDEFVNESFIGSRFHGPDRRDHHRRRPAGFVPRSPAGPGSPAPPSTCWIRPIRSRPASCYVMRSARGPSLWSARVTPLGRPAPTSRPGGAARTRRRAGTDRRRSDQRR